MICIWWKTKREKARELTASVTINVKGEMVNVNNFIESLTCYWVKFTKTFSLEQIYIKQWHNVLDQTHFFWWYIHMGYSKPKIKIYFVLKASLRKSVGRCTKNCTKECKLHKSCIWKTITHWMNSSSHTLLCFEFYVLHIILVKCYLPLGGSTLRSNFSQIK